MMDVLCKKLIKSINNTKEKYYANDDLAIINCRLLGGYIARLLLQVNLYDTDMKNFVKENNEIIEYVLKYVNTRKSEFIIDTMFDLEHIDILINLIYISIQDIILNSSIDISYSTILYNTDKGFKKMILDKKIMRKNEIELIKSNFNKI